MRWKEMVFVLLLVPLSGCAEPPRFDYYLLALSVAPAFCEDEPHRKQTFSQCRELSESGFKAMPLTLHGLWPNRIDHKHPAFCEGIAGGGFCRLPSVDLSADARSRLQRVMPAMADCLDRYQWAKHGSCSGLRKADYFRDATALTERVNRAIGGEIARHMGGEISLEFLREVLARIDPALKDAVTFDCRTPRTQNPDKRFPMLREVRVYFERNSETGAPGYPLAYTRAGVRHYNSGCPQGKAYIDTPPDF